MVEAIGFVSLLLLTILRLFYAPQLMPNLEKNSATATHKSVIHKLRVNSISF